MSRRILLVSRPTGVPEESNFKLEEVPIPSEADVAEGQVLVKTNYLSVDPYMSGIIREGPSYAKNVELGSPMPGGSVGEVLVSKDANFQKGDVVHGGWGWQEHAIVDAKTLHKVDTRVPVSTALGVLGMPGATAYLGLLEIGQPKANETVVVTAAAGAVGSLVGQIAKIKGCRVVGIAGGQDKCDHLTKDLGFDAALDYKKYTTTEDLRAALKEACPNGIDVHFDNVGGEIASTILDLINPSARIVICGAISQYNKPAEAQNFRTDVNVVLLKKRAKMQGFIVGLDFAPHTWGPALKQIAEWILEKKVKYQETVVTGFENTPKAFISLFTGANVGKLVVKC